MDDSINLSIPESIAAIDRDTKDCGFTMASDYQTGSLLRTLSASKIKGNILELGTGTGLSACWLLDGMDQHSKLVTVDNDHNVVDIAKTHLSCDPRIDFNIQMRLNF